MIFGLFRPGNQAQYFFRDLPLTIEIVNVAYNIELQSFTFLIYDKSFPLLGSCEYPPIIDADVETINNRKSDDDPDPLRNFITYDTHVGTPDGGATKKVGTVDVAVGISEAHVMKALHIERFHPNGTAIFATGHCSNTVIVLRNPQRQFEYVNSDVVANSNAYAKLLDKLGIRYFDHFGNPVYEGPMKPFYQIDRNGNIIETKK